MKLDRLLSILMILIQKHKVQAKDLADQFEVSVRTIYRDIETINMAGIPIVTYQGSGGGIGIDDRYRLDKNMLSGDEISSIVTALRSLQSTYKDSSTQLALHKIEATYAAAKSEWKEKSDELYVDFSDWGSNPVLQNKLNGLKSAINGLRKVSFDYSNAKGEFKRRLVEPHTLVLKNRNWYLYAFCREKEAFRLFKLMRMKNISEETASFVRRPIRLEQLPWNEEWHQQAEMVKLRLRFRPEVRYLLEEWFDAESIMDQNNGHAIVEIEYPNDNWIYGFILGFGDLVEVVEPAFVRERLKVLLSNMNKIY